jgi:CO dehydrogenase maturation factor
MKVSVCGKGGSGKSSIVALMAREAAVRGYRVLVVDSDESNTGLYRILGFDRPPVPLMDMLGGKKGLKEKLSQPGLLAEDKIPTDAIPPQHLLQQDGLMLLSIGKILQSLEGCACPMGVLSREFLKKLSLVDKELAIVDMEAGVEHFGRGVDASIDSIIIVVEPSVESLELAKRIKELSESIDITNIWAVLNKVSSPAVADKLTAEVDKMGVEIIGVIHQDEALAQASLEGVPFEDGRAAAEIKPVVNAVLKAQ